MDSEKDPTEKLIGMSDLVQANNCLDSPQTTGLYFL